MVCIPTVYPEQLPKFLGQKTKQPNGTQVTVVLRPNINSGKPEFLTYKGDMRDVFGNKGPASLYEARGGRWYEVSAPSAAGGATDNRTALTEKDKELILQQCENQGATGEEQIQGFTNAYKEAKTLALQGLNRLNAEQVQEYVLRWAQMIEPRNAKGYRTTPVYFAHSGTNALDADKIERAIGSFYRLYAEGVMTPREAYEEFEKIHPFEDGNGRVGDLLWKLAVTLEESEWPETLPPDVFGEQTKDPEYCWECGEHTGTGADKLRHHFENHPKEKGVFRKNWSGKTYEFSFPEQTAEFAQRVKNNGGQALVVGGSVRDLLLGKESKDIDIEVYGVEPGALALVMEADIRGRGTYIPQRSAKIKELAERAERLNVSAAKPEPLLYGRDLIEHLGLRPGPQFGTILNAVYEKQLEGELSSKDEALRFVKEKHPK